MSDCCCSPEIPATPSRKRDCPLHGGECAEVSSRTIAHHIRQSWLWQDSGQRYFFCDDPDCEVVYFGEDGSVILQSQLRTRVGAKEAAADAPLCYCFGISRADAATDPGIRDYVVQMTREGLCSCETSNPSGRCCLKDFPDR